MAFREVRVFEVREVLRLWLAGRGYPGDGAAVRGGPQDGPPLRGGGGRAGSGPRRRRGAADRRVHRQVVEAVRPHRRDGHGEAWRLLEAHHDQIAGVARRRGADGGEGPRAAWSAGGSWCRSGRCSATWSRCAVARRARARRCGSPTASRATSCRSTSVAWAWSSTRRRAGGGWCQALIFTACCSPALLRVAERSARPPTAVIDGFEAAWAFFGGVFAHGDPRQPVGDRRRGRPARAPVEPGVRRVRPGPRVRDRPGPGASPAGQAPGGADGAVRAPLVLRRRDLHRPGRRAAPGRGVVPDHGPGCGSTAPPSAGPAEVFAVEEQPRLLPAPTAPYDLPHLRHGRRCTGTITSRWPRRSTRCPAT